VRITSSVTSISWIPSEAIQGMTKLPFEAGMSHYDPPPPDVLDDVDDLRLADRFRFANRLEAWIEVEGGRIVDCGHAGQGLIGATILRLGSRSASFPAVPFPDLQSEPEIAPDGTSARFVQTAGGRTGVPAPRHVNRPPYIQLVAPLAWTTLALTLRVDGSAEFEVVGASPFPRHWIYGYDHSLAAKSGTIDFKEWYRTAFGKHTPWGDEDSPALVTAAETALERRVSAQIMRGDDRKPEINCLRAGDRLVAQGDPGGELFVLLDGVLVVEVDGVSIAEVGPGAILGERAILEGGRRTSTLRAVTAAKVAVAAAADIDEAALAEISASHRREDR
jgi:hypothetical protein